MAPVRGMNLLGSGSPTWLVVLKNLSVYSNPSFALFDADAVLVGFLEDVIHKPQTPPVAKRQADSLAS